MKRSHRVTLLVIGTLALAGCADDDDTTYQSQYRSLQDCQDEWGTDPRNCTPRAGGSGSSSSTHFGPRYYWDRGINRPVTVDESGNRRVITGSHLTSPGNSSRAISTRTSSASRGGFGASARAGTGGG